MSFRWWIPIWFSVNRPSFRFLDQKCKYFCRWNRNGLCYSASNLGIVQWHFLNELGIRRLVICLFSTRLWLCRLVLLSKYTCYLWISWRQFLCVHWFPISTCFAISRNISQTHRSTPPELHSHHLKSKLKPLVFWTTNCAKVRISSRSATFQTTKLKCSPNHRLSQKCQFDL